MEVLSDIESLLASARDDFKRFKKCVADALACLGHPHGPLTEQEVSQGFLYAGQCEEFDLRTTNFRWNADYSGFVAEPR